jgi:hypothetical protein
MTMAHEGFPDAWGSSSCTSTGIIERHYLYKTSWELRHRTGMTGEHPQINAT